MDLRKSNAKFDFSGKVCLITGAGLGIGRAVARVFAASGCNLVLCDINKSALEETKALIDKETQARVILSVLDVRNYTALEAAAQSATNELGGLDFCIANAGIARCGNVAVFTEDEFDTIVDINMKGVFLTVKACSREMIKLNRGGRIITMSSANAVIAGATASAYCGTKAAVAMMTRCWAQDLCPYGILVNCIGPGATDTGLMVSQVENPDAMKGLMNAIPLGRMAAPEEVAYCCAFYCSDVAAYLNGTFLLQDGGLMDHSVERAPVLKEISEQRATMSGSDILSSMEQARSQERTQEQAQREKFALH